MTAFETRLEKDQKVARDAKRQFCVLAKESTSVPWKRKGDRFEDLCNAFAMVRSLRAERIAIHIDCEGKGLLYWSSDAPDVLNSHLLPQRLTPNAQQSTRANAGLGHAAG